MVIGYLAACLGGEDEPGLGEMFPVSASFGDVGSERNLMGDGPVIVGYDGTAAADQATPTVSAVADEATQASGSVWNSRSVWTATWIQA